MNMLISIYFDGGCRPTNPGNKYGSFEVVFNGDSLIKASRIEFGWGTNNEAEFDSLIKALDWTISQLFAGGLSPKDFRVQMETDSTIVRGRIQDRKTGGKGEAAQRMGSLTKTCLSRLDTFASYSISWRGRIDNVQRFGH